MPIVDWLTQPYSQYFPSDLLAVLSAMVWGQKDGLTPYYRDLFLQTGLLHLLVLSGQNISLMVGFFEWTGEYFGRTVKLCIQLLISLFYLSVFFTEPSIVRASIMSVVTTLSLLMQKTVWSLPILLFTAFIMLIVRPEWIASISFWLSFSATFGIVVFYPPLREYCRVRKIKSSNYFVTTFLISLSAQILTTPLILLFFRETTLIALPMNVLVGWLVEPIMVLGFFVSFAGHIPFVGHIISVPLFGLLKLFMEIVRYGYEIGKFMTIRI